MMMFLHYKLNIVHRDIKPANILYSVKRKKYMFCDFGMSHTVK